MRHFLLGFYYAWRGICHAMQQERNLRFHLCTAGLVLFFAAKFYAFTRAEWGLLWLCIALVMALELANSAIERAVDAPDAAHWAAAGAAKDMAAGAVLVGALGAVAVGVCLFGRMDVLRQIVRYYAAASLHLLGLAAALVAMGWFIFGWRKPEERSAQK